MSKFTESFESEQPFSILCYSKEDDDKVLPIIEQLEKSGYRVKCMCRGSERMTWSDNLFRLGAQDNCAQFIVFVSNSTIGAENVKYETCLADHCQKNCVVVSVEDPQSGQAIKVPNQGQSIKWFEQENAASLSMLKKIIPDDTRDEYASEEPDFFDNAEPDFFDTAEPEFDETADSLVSSASSTASANTAPASALATTPVSAETTVPASARDQVPEGATGVKEPEPAKTEQEPVKTAQKPAKVEQKTEQKPVINEQKPAKAEPKPVKKEPKPVKTEEKPVKAEKKPTKAKSYSSQSKEKSSKGFLALLVATLLFSIALLLFVSPLGDRFRSHGGSSSDNTSSAGNPVAESTASSTTEGESAIANVEETVEAMSTAAALAESTSEAATESTEEPTSEVVTESETALQVESSTEAASETTLAEITDSNLRTVNHVGSKKANAPTVASDFVQESNGEYSFYYPKDYFEEGTYNEADHTYSFKTHDGGVAMTITEIDVPYKNDPIKSAKALSRQQKANLMANSKVEGIYEKSFDVLPESGYGRSMISGQLEDTPDKGAYTMYVCDNNKAYVYTMTYPLDTTQTKSTGAREPEIGYIIDSFYRGWDISGCNYYIRSYQQYLNDDMGERRVKAQ